MINAKVNYSQAKYMHFMDFQELSVTPQWLLMLFSSYDDTSFGLPVRVKKERLCRNRNIVSDGYA